MKSHRWNRQLQSRIWGPIEDEVVVDKSVAGSRVVVVSSAGEIIVVVDAFVEGRDVGMVFVGGSVVVLISRGQSKQQRTMLSISGHHTKNHRGNRQFQVSGMSAVLDRRQMSHVSSSLAFVDFGERDSKDNDV